MKLAEAEREFNIEALENHSFGARVRVVCGQKTAGVLAILVWIFQEGSLAFPSCARQGIRNYRTGRT